MSAALAILMVGTMLFLGIVAGNTYLTLLLIFSSGVPHKPDTTRAFLLHALFWLQAWAMHALEERGPATDRWHMPILVLTSFLMLFLPNSPFWLVAQWWGSQAGWSAALVLGGMVLSFPVGGLLLSPTLIHPPGRC